MIKLDILTSLALEPASIEAVLKELRTYIRHDDTVFVCASIRAVGRVVELARIVYDRHGEKAGDPTRARNEANRIGMNCLYGLMMLTQACDHEVVVGESTIVMQRIIGQLTSDSSGAPVAVDDPHHIQDKAMKRIVLLLVRSLASRSEEEETNDEDDDGEKVVSDLDALTVSLPPEAVASALWIVGEWIASLSKSPLLVRKLDAEAKSKMRLELIRLVAKSFPNLEPCEKTAGVHFASKLLVSAASGADSASGESAICENVLSMGRVDVNTDARDRARCESTVIHVAIGLKHDTDAMTNLPSAGRTLTVENAKTMLLRSKPPSSSLPLEDEKETDPSTEENGPFRFGTLSSLVSHRAREAYLPLPQWAEKDSAASLRDPPSPAATPPEEVDYGWKVGTGKQVNGGFYDSGDNETGTSSSSESASESSESDSSSGEESSSSSSGASGSSEEDSDSESDDYKVVESSLLHSFPKPTVNGGPKIVPAPRAQALVDEPSSDDATSDSEESDDSDSPNDPPKAEGNLLGMVAPTQPSTLLSMDTPKKATNGTSIIDGLAGLVMAPIVVDSEEEADPDIDKDSGAWMQLVRPELGGGLMVSARYLRGPTREREAKLMCLDPESVTTVCLQVNFENR
jgi:AP-3 complex subunit beta